MLNIGLLFLQKGKYNGKQIVSEEYVKEAITPSKNNPQYGYFWWVGKDFYGCRGFGGQNITIFPSEKKVCVIQATPTARGKEYDDVIQMIR